MKNLALILITLHIIVGCKTTMGPGGELISNSNFIVEQDGKSVWLIYRDSTGFNYSENGVHKIKYTSFKYFNRYKLALTFYGINNDKIDTLNHSYTESVQVVKNGKIIKECFFDKYGNLIQPNYLFYAKSKTKLFKNGTARVRYYNEHNKPSCSGRAFEIIYRQDTIWNRKETDTTFMIQSVELKKRDCHRKTIN